MDYLFYTCLLLFATDVSGMITNAPLNAVAEVGQQAIFNCTSDRTTQNWVLSAKKEDAAAEVIVVGCVVEPGFTTHYEVDRPGGNTNCNLIVKDTTMQQAGIYTCKDIQAERSAILTVTDKLLNATYNTTEGVVVEKETVIIECLLNYNGSMAPAPTLRPYFYWTNSTHNVSSSYDSTSNDTAVSQLTVTADRQDITPFTCHVYFQLIPPTNNGYASNTPTVSNSATSPIITVLHCPGNIKIESTVSTADKCVYKKENLTCTADANPPAEYEWHFNNSKTYGAVKSISSGGKYQCTAFNTIRSKPCNITEAVSEDDCYPVVEKNMTISGPSCTNDSCSCPGGQPIELTCDVYSLPTPEYRWNWDDGSQPVYFENQTIRVTYNGIYSCTAKSSFGTNSSMATVSAVVSNCTEPPTTAAQSTTTTTHGPSPLWFSLFLLCIPIISLILGFLCFPIHYNKSALKDDYNKRFPWLKKMLPCLNRPTDTSVIASIRQQCATAGWIILYIVMVTTVGIIVIPIVFFTVHDVQCCKFESKENIESTTFGPNSTSTTPNTMSTGTDAGLIAGIVIGCFLGINILMTCFFIGYYTILETSSAMTGRSGNVKTGRNKIRLNKRFPWLQKMLPCLNDTKDAAGTNFPWVLLFTLLATVTGFITFPVWVALSIKSETNNEMSVLNKRDDEANENTGNGSPTYTPVGKRTKASHLEDPYQNSAGDIELNSSLHSRNHRPTDSPTLNASIRGKPPAPPKNKPTVNSPNRSMEYPINGSAALNYLEPTTYAELPIKPGNTSPTPSPVQLLVPDDPSDNYAVLNKT